MKVIHFNEDYMPKPQEQAASRDMFPVMDTMQLIQQNKNDELNYRDREYKLFDLFFDNEYGEENLFSKITVPENTPVVKLESKSSYKQSA